MANLISSALCVTATAMTTAARIPTQKKSVLKSAAATGSLSYTVNHRMRRFHGVEEEEEEEEDEGNTEPENVSPTPSSSQV